MPALITSAIPQQGFEKVRDLIAAILLVELTNQKQLQGAEMPETFSIYTESLLPMSSAEDLVISVHCAGAKYGEMTQQDAQGRTLYYIDVDASAEEGEVAGQTGSTVSAQRLQKYLGMIMYIFRSPYYRMMGLPPGLIGGTYVEQFDTLDPNRKEDTDFTSFGRIVLAVRIQANTETWAGVPLEINNTTVTLDLTEKGYKFVFENS